MGKKKGGKKVRVEAREGKEGRGGERGEKKSVGGEKHTYSVCPSWRVCVT